VNPIQDYSNYTPKKIQQFKGKDKPNVVDMAFGWYHEAYIDSKRDLYACSKAKLTSIEVEGVRDGDRPDMTKVETLPKGTKVKQVAFTQSRMFVLSEKGELFLYKINEIVP
jgi:alpha-tubulin suppressor-like RCC1 family protein